MKFVFAILLHFVTTADLTNPPPEEMECRSCTGHKRKWEHMGKCSDNATLHKVYCSTPYGSRPTSEGSDTSGCYSRFNSEGMLDESGCWSGQITHCNRNDTWRRIKPSWEGCCKSEFQVYAPNSDNGTIKTAFFCRCAYQTMCNRNLTKDWKCTVENKCKKLVTLPPEQVGDFALRSATASSYLLILCFVAFCVIF